MKILILAAMDKEISLLTNLISNPSLIQISGLEVWQGIISGSEIFISKCGIGKVNSAVNTLKLIQEIHPELVINSGVAGGAGLPVGSVLVADRVAYHDVWCGPGTVYGQADGVPLYMLPDEGVLNIARKNDVVSGLICSGDKFISTPEEIKFIREKFPDVKAVDMESASIAQTCFLCHVPFSIVRMVSDTPGEGENISQYLDFWKNAPLKTFSVLKEVITNYTQM